MIRCVGHGPGLHEHWQVLIGAESITCCCPGIAAEMYQTATGIRALLRFPPAAIACPLEPFATWDAQFTSAR